MSLIGKLELVFCIGLRVFYALLCMILCALAKCDQCLGTGATLHLVDVVTSSSDRVEVQQ